jgi:hypothetical protein
MRQEDIVPLIREFPDRSIRWLLETPDNLHGLLSVVVGDLAKRIDYSRTELLNRTFILDDFRKREADIIFKVPFFSPKDNGSISKVIIYILIENQSTVDRMMPFRMLSYMMQVWNMEMQEWESDNIPLRQRYFRPILPVVFYTGSQHWESPLEMKQLVKIPDGLEMLIPQFKIFLLNLKSTAPEQLVSEDNPFGWVLRVMQKEDQTTEEFKKELSLAVTHLEQMPLEKLSDWQKLMYFLFMFIYNRRDPRERSELLKVVETNVVERIRREEVDKMGRTIAQALIEEGMVEGIEKGKKEGLSQGMQQMIFETLELRFEIAPISLIEAISNVMNVNTLRILQRYAVQSGSIKDFEEKMKAIVETNRML